MLQTLTKKLLLCLTGLLILITCTSCRTRPAYLFKDFLNELSLSSGIGASEDINDNLDALNKWGVNFNSEELDNELTYKTLSDTLISLIDEDDNFYSLKNKNIIDSSAKETQTVSYEKGVEIIKKAVNYINNKHIEPVYDYEYVKEIKNENDELNDGDIIYTNDGYKKVETIDDNQVLTEAKLEDVYAYLEIADSYTVDFENAEVIPYGDEENTSYINEKFNLLSSKNHVFNSEGFRISYTLNKSGIDVHVSKNENGVNIYGDVSIHNVKPTFKWTYKEDDLKNCYFKLDFNTTEKVGASIGKYGNYHMKFKDVDASSFKSLLNSVVEKEKDELEASIPICQIKTPIPNVPTAYLNIDLLIKLYVSGKVEVVLMNEHSLGFETKEGNIRFINDNSHDLDLILQASTKAALGLNLNLEAVKFRLCDVELDGGIRGLVKSTMHLYDDEGNASSETSNVAYSTLQELSEGNNDVKVCGDVSLYYLLDLIINTPKTQMAKMGFSKTLNILDEDNQVFNNLHHIEDGHFVKKCTRKNRVTLQQMESVKSNRIVLESYAEVIKRNETYQIKIISLPEGYSENDISYSSLDSSIAKVENDLIKPISPGSTKIKVYTKDNKYNSYVNVLVSSE